MRNDDSVIEKACLYSAVCDLTTDYRAEQLYRVAQK